MILIKQPCLDSCGFAQRRGRIAKEPGNFQITSERLDSMRGQLPTWALDTRSKSALSTGSVSPAAPLPVSSAWSTLAALAFAGAAVLAGHPAKAALGADVGTVETDRQHIHATVQRSAHGAFNVHALTMPNGTVVREYVSLAGTVFAVSWHGRVIPDLKQLLGAQFATFSASPHRQRGGLGHLLVQDAAQNPNLVIESNGRAPSFHGRAYLNNSLPAGVTVNDIE